MRFLYQRGPGAKRRVMHLSGFNPRSGKPDMKAACGDRRLVFDTTCNLPLGRPVCKKCRRVVQEEDTPNG